MALGDEYTILCAASNTNRKNFKSIHWIVPPNSSRLVVSKEVRKSTAGDFIARFGAIDDNIILCSLTFTANANLNQKVIICRDPATLDSVECRLRIITTATCKLFNLIQIQFNTISYYFMQLRQYLPESQLELLLHQFYLLVQALCYLLQLSILHLCHCQLCIQEY